MNASPTYSDSTITNKPAAFRLGELITAVFLGLSLTICTGVVIGWGTAVVRAMLQSNRSYSYESVFLRDDGEPFLERRDALNNSRFFDIHGDEIFNLPHRAFSNFVSPVSLPGPTETREKDRDLNIDSLLVKMNSASAETDFVNWFFVDNSDRPGSGYLVGIHRISRRQLGYLGRKGWQPIPPTLDDQFDTSTAAMPFEKLQYETSGYEPRTTVADDPRIYSPIILDGGRPWLANLETHSLAQTGREEGVLSACRLNTHTSRHLREPEKPAYQLTDYFAFRTRDHVIFFDSTNGETSQWRLPESIAATATSFAFLKDNVLIAFDRKMIDFPRTLQRESLYWLNTSGDVTRSVQFELNNSQSLDDIILTAMRLNGAPVIGVLADGYVLPAMKTGLPEVSYLQRLQQLFPISWPWWLLDILYVAAAISLTRRHAHSHHVPLQPMWYVFLAILGIPGYLGYRWHRHWPPQVIPAAPALNGTEILVPA